MEWKLNHPIVYPTVDCAIFEDANMKHIYLARKPNQELYRFVGGFVDPSDSSFQDAARREAFEETGVRCTITDWVTSTRIDDPRYENKEDKIITTLFTMYVSDWPKVPTAKDDIADIKLFDVKDLHEDMFVPEHKVLFFFLNGWMRRKGLIDD